MKRFLGAVVVMGFLAGCGAVDSNQQGADEVLGSVDSKLMTGVHYFQVRRDTRRCAAPLCGGFWLTELNNPAADEQYVSELDFANVRIDTAEVAKVLQAGDEELVVAGTFSAQDPRGCHRLMVTEAYRGLPGVKVNAGDIYYFAHTTDIRCITAPCPTELARLINTQQSEEFNGYSMAFAPAHVDPSWLKYEVTQQGAVIAGEMGYGAPMPAGNEKILTASQVFLPIPFMQRPCPLQRPTVCGENQVVVYESDEDRCVLEVGCATPGVCTLSIPTCDAGYTLRSWRSGPNACPAYRCDPTFILQ